MRASGGTEDKSELTPVQSRDRLFPPFRLFYIRVYFR